MVAPYGLVGHDMSHQSVSMWTSRAKYREAQLYKRKKNATKKNKYKKCNKQTNKSNKQTNKSHRQTNKVQSKREEVFPVLDMSLQSVSMWTS